MVRRCLFFVALCLVAGQDTISFSPEERHGNEEQEQHVEVDDVTWTTALLLISFVVMSMGAVYLVHSSDVDIRKEGWTLIRRTMSIFCAASIDFSICWMMIICLAYVTGEKIDKHTDTWDFQLAVFLFACIIFLLLLLVLLDLSPEENMHFLTAATRLGSRILAFASILFLGHVQKLTFFNQSWFAAFLVPCLALLFCMLAYPIAILAKRREPEWWTRKKERVDHVLQALQEATAISVGFLLCQVACYVLSESDVNKDKFMPIIGGPPGRHRPFSTTIFWTLACMLLSFSAIWTVRHRRMHSHRTMKRFLSNLVGLVTSNTGCWCLQRGGLILFYQLCSDRMYDYQKHVLCKGTGHCEDFQINPVKVTNRATITNAAFMSVLSVVCILVMDKVADLCEGKGSMSPGQLQMDLGEEPCGSPCEPRAFLRGDLESVGSASSEMELDFQSMASSLRTVMGSFGVLVGICWNKAFETAYAVILEHDSWSRMMSSNEEAKQFLEDNEIKVGLLLASVGFVLSLFVLPGWYWYIMPFTLKEEAEHGAAISTEYQQFKLLELTKRKSAHVPSESSETDSA